MSQTRKVDDAGEKIGGARKDMWRARVMTPDDLDSLNIEEAVAFVSKDLVWPKPDYSALAEAGYEPEALALQKIVRDRLPVAAVMPHRVSPGQDLREVHRQYVEMIGMLRDAAARLKTGREMRGFHNEIYNELDWHNSGWRSNEVRSKLDSITSGRRRPFELRSGDLDKAEALVREGFPNSKVAPWLRGVTIKNRGDEFYAVRGREITTRGHSNREAAVAALKADYEAKRSKKASEPKSPPHYRERLDAITREGLPDHRNGSSVTPQAFIDEFGFRGVQFGKWLPDAERQLVLDHAFDALCDLADVLRVPRFAISLGGRLSAAFGARGNGQAAHFETITDIFNLSRLSGAGAIAHEWGHFFDNYAGIAGSSRPINGSTRSGSGWYEWRLPRAPKLADLGPEAAELWDRTMSAIRYRPLTHSEQLAVFDKRIEEATQEIQKFTESLERFLGMGGAEKNPKYHRELLAYIDSQQKAKARLEEKRRTFAAVPGQAGATSLTNFMREAVKVGGSNSYRQRPTEMFARAFESAVFDALKASGARSEYLVYGVEEDRYSDPTLWKMNPYPSGAERETICDATLELVRAVTPIIVSKFEPTPAPSPAP